jgi:hypothetical protein
MKNTISENEDLLHMHKDWLASVEEIRGLEIKTTHNKPKSQ